VGGYHLHLRKMYPQQWPNFSSTPGPKEGVPPASLISLLQGMAAKMPIYYLHPSFGYYFEYFEMRPRGLVYELQPYPTNSISGAPLSVKEIAEADRFWNEVKGQELDVLIRKIPPAIFSDAGKTVERPVTLEMYIGSFYSRTLNYLGVAIQRAGDFPKAASYYELALKLNPMNAAAYINLDYNRQYLAGNKEGGKPSEGATKRIAASGGTMESVLGAHGPLEEPSACYSLARLFNQGNIPRQAAQNIERTTFYTPQNMSAQVLLVALAVRASITDFALQRITELRDSSILARLSDDEMMDLITSEAWARASQNDLPSAERILTAAQTRYPQQSAPWSTLFDIYLTRGRLTNAVDLIGEQLKTQPNNVQALVNSAYLQMQLANHSNALPLLNRALRISPKDERALLNRGIVNLTAGQLDEAQRDFDALYSGAGSRSPQVLFGLAETHFKRKNRKDALRLYRMVEEILPEQDAERRTIQERIKILESGVAL
jgi:tetratricopeptide (TPR) repeat protein